MSIEPVRRVTILVPHGQTEAFLSWLYARAEFALEDVAEYADQGRLSLQRNTFERQMGVLVAKLARARQIVDATGRFSEQQASFLDRLLPVKTVVGARELEEIVESFDLDGMAGLAADLRRRHGSALRRLRSLEARREEIEPLAGISVPLSQWAGLKRVRLRLVRAVGRPPDLSAAGDPAARLLQIQAIAEHGGAVIAAACWLPGDDEAAQGELGRLGFRELPLPDLEGTAKQELRRLDRELGEAKAELEAVETEYRRLAPLHERALIAQAYLEAEQRRLQEAERTWSSRRVGVISGWILDRTAAGFRQALEAAFGGAQIVFQDPDPGEAVPVRLTSTRLLRPPQLLVQMFGLPEHTTFDPTPFLMLPFFVFFGICFGDVLYGALLVLLALYLKRRYRRQRGLLPGFSLFLYAGISTMAFGALTGSWAADLYQAQYLGEGNLLGRVAARTQKLDMLENPLVALSLALGIGVANQFWGLMLAFYREARRGNWLNAVADSAAWIVFLSGLLLLLVNTTAALALIVPGAAVLVVFQGRREKTLVGRAVSGVVSLYGVLGSYGAVAFLGDVLSYSRLMALGLTTTIIGSAVNIIAALVREASYVGWLLFVLALAVGHVFNFLVSLLGAFVHSARLILLEFFGRFYQGGARPFVPYGFRSEKLEVVETT